LGDQDSAGEVLGLGALVRLRRVNGRLFVETSDGSHVLAAAPGELRDLDVQTGLLQATEPAARREDLRRILGRLQLEGAAQ
jgi:hypothetical protein